MEQASSTQTPPFSAKLTEIVSILQKDYRASPFLLPVDYRKLMLFNYPLVIKNPMDLSTLYQNIQDGLYKDLNAFRRDLQLIWDNCRAFNMEGSDIYCLAEDLDLFSKELLKSIEEKGEGKVGKKRGRKPKNRGSSSYKEFEENREEKEGNSSIVKGNPDGNMIKLEENHDRIEETHIKLDENQERIKQNQAKLEEFSKKIVENTIILNNVNISTFKLRNPLKRQAKPLENIPEEVFFHKKLKLNDMTKRMSVSQIKKLISIIKSENYTACDILSPQKLVIKLDSLLPEIVQKLIEIFEKEIFP